MCIASDFLLLSRKNTFFYPQEPADERLMKAFSLWVKKKRERIHRVSSRKDTGYAHGYPHEKREKEAFCMSGFACGYPVDETPW